MKIKFIIFYLTLFLGTTISSQNKLMTKVLDNYFDKLSSHDKFMGSVSIAENNKVMYQKSVGYDNIELKKKSTSDSRYRISSVSKLFTAVLTLKAIEEKRINFDDDLSQYVPYLSKSKEFSVKALLQQKYKKSDFTDENNDTTRGLSEIISHLKRSFGGNLELAYNELNYCILSKALENIYSKKYAILLKDKIIEPFDLKNTFSAESIDGFGKETSSYFFKEVWNKNIGFKGVYGISDVVSSPVDINKFMYSLFQGQIITKQNLEFLKDDKGKHRLGLFKFPYFDYSGYGYAGSVDGFFTISLFLPLKNSYAITITSNGINYNKKKIVIDVLNRYFNKPYKPLSFDKISLTENDLKKYLGAYISNDIALEINVFNKNNVLVLQASGQEEFSVTPEGSNVFTHDQTGILLKFFPEKDLMVFNQSGKQFIFRKI